MSINGKDRATMAKFLQPFLTGRSHVGLAETRDALQRLFPARAHEIDGRETSHVLRRAGFQHIYGNPGPATYRRSVARHLGA